MSNDSNDPQLWLVTMDVKMEWFIIGEINKSKPGKPRFDQGLKGLLQVASKSQRPLSRFRWSKLVTLDADVQNKSNHVGKTIINHPPVITIFMCYV